jgi:DNA repair exonuclease SbcCD nuclease subunit
MVKILHISDVHLEMIIGLKNTEKRKILQYNTNNAFINSVNYAINNEIDIFLIAGDLFDSIKPSYGIYIFLKENIEKLKLNKIKVIYANGNHDYTISKDIINLFDFTFNSNTPKTYTMEAKSGRKVYIHGAGYEKRHEQVSVINYFPPKIDDGSINIGILHLQLEGTTNELETGVYMPTNLNDIEKLGYDYFAIGHIHKRISYGNICYSGSLAPLAIDETGSKGGFIVEIEEKTNINPVNFSNLIILNEKMQLEIELLSEFESKEYIIAKLIEYISTYDDNIYLILNLTIFSDIYLKNLEEDIFMYNNFKRLAGFEINIKLIINDKGFVEQLPFYNDLINMLETEKSFENTLDTKLLDKSIDLNSEKVKKDILDNIIINIARIKHDS